MDVDEQATHLERLQKLVADAGYGNEVATGCAFDHRLALLVWRLDRPGAIQSVTVESHPDGPVYRWPQVIGVEPLGPVADPDKALEEIRATLGPSR